jgi:hypothetical protein
MFPMNQASKILLLLLIVSCSKEDPQANEAPSIIYEGVEKIKTQSGKDTAFMVFFSFKDANGDIGFREEDTVPPYTLPPYNFNLVAEFKGIENGEEVFYLIQPSNTDTFDYSQRIQSLTPAGRYKGISGKMELKVEFGFLPLLIGTLPDSVKLNIHLIDRALNKSNQISTPVIALDF